MSARLLVGNWLNRYYSADIKPNTISNGQVVLDWEIDKTGNTCIS